MSRKKQNTGDVIDLCWEDKPLWFNVRGHIDFDKAEKNFCDITTHNRENCYSAFPK